MHINALIPRGVLAHYCFDHLRCAAVRAAVRHCCAAVRAAVRHCCADVCMFGDDGPEPLACATRMMCILLLTVQCHCATEYRAPSSWRLWSRRAPSQGGRRRGGAWIQGPPACRMQVNRTRAEHEQSGRVVCVRVYMFGPHAPTYIYIRCVLHYMYYSDRSSGSQ